MSRVFVSIGSNIDKERTIRAGVAALQHHFGVLRCSSVYESSAVGFEGDNFLNLVAQFDSDLDVGALNRILHQIEDQHGRDRSSPRFSARSLDIDLLLVDQLIINEPWLSLPRAEITVNAFVLWPLAELAPEGIHPQLGCSYAELWSQFESGDQQLWPIEFYFSATD